MSEDEQLAADLADALQEMVNLSCMTMVPLWLDASKKIRKGLRQAPVEDELPRDYPMHLKRPMSGPSKSKYKALACWRHVVVWKDLLSNDVPNNLVLERANDSEFHSYQENVPMMRAIYFTECPDETPFSYSQKKSSSPAFRDGALDEYDVFSLIKACWVSLHIIKSLYEEAEGGYESECLYLGIKYQVLNDVLKIDDFIKTSNNKAVRKKYEWVPPHKRKEKLGDIIYG